MNGSLQLKVQQDMGSVNIDSAGMFEKTTIPVVQYTLRKKDDNITKLRKSGRGGVKVILFAQYLFSFSLRIWGDIPVYAKVSWCLYIAWPWNVSESLIY